MILYQKTKEELNIDFNKCKVYTEIFCKCDYCGEIFKRTKRSILAGRKVIEKESCNSKKCAQSKREESQIKLYGVKNFGGSKESLEKHKKTCLERYGVESTSSLPEIKEKIKNTNLKKYGKTSYLGTKECKDAAKVKAQELYGVDNFSKAEAVKQKIKESNLKNNGVEYPMQSEKIKNKSKKTCLKKYGCENINQCKEIKEKQKKTLFERYGSKHPLQIKKFKEKQQKTLFENYGVTTPLHSLELKEKSKKTCLSKYGVTNPLKNIDILKKTLETKKERYGSYYPIFKKSESEIKNWINSFGFNFDSDIEILDGKEIDMLDKSLSFAIEYCGLFWHNEESLEPRDKNYHFKKYKDCLDAGIHLITIFEDEWHHRKKQCQNFLKSKIKIFDKKIFARKCEIKQISKKEAKEFYDDNHIQGSSQGLLVAYGLFNQEELLGVMSLGRHHRDSSKITLDRFCVKEGCHISGGASKLFKACKNWAIQKGCSKIISWSDNRWSDGNVYKILGFKLEEELAPDYSYVNIKNPNKIRINKQSQSKKRTNCPEDKTEKEWCLERGLSRIWDCGKKRWVFEL